MVAVVAAAHCPDAEAGTLHSMVLEMKSAVTLSLPASDEDGLQVADCNLKMLAHVAMNAPLWVELEAACLAYIRAAYS